MKTTDVNSSGISKVIAFKRDIADIFLTTKLSSATTLLLKYWSVITPLDFTHSCRNSNVDFH